MRKIKIDNKVFDINISNEEEIVPLGRTTSAQISGHNILECKIDNALMLDGKINFTKVKTAYQINDKRYDNLLKMNIINRNEQWELLNNIPIDEKIATIKFGLKYDTFHNIDKGFRYGYEAEFENFCITYNAKKFRTFASNDFGFIFDEYLSMKDTHKQFKSIRNLLVKRLRREMILS